MALNRERRMEVNIGKGISPITGGILFCFLINMLNRGFGYVKSP
jgi:hypothetical protein